MKGDWRSYFEDEKKAKELKPDKRRKILQSARRRASVCIADLTSIAKGLRSVSGSEETFRRQIVEMFGNGEAWYLAKKLANNFTRAQAWEKICRRHKRKKERDSRDFRRYELVMKKGELVRREES